MTAAYTKAASSAAAAKMGEAADGLRAKIGSELVKLRGKQQSRDAAILPQ